MYIFFYQSFLYLSVPEVLLFTVFTPFYVTFINVALDRKFNVAFAISTFVAIIGAVTIRYKGIDEGFFKGSMVVQGANLSVAIGQVAYKRVIEKERPNLAQRSMFGWLFLGALVVVVPCYLIMGNPEKLPSTPLQWGILTYLGVFASGIGYFAWNKGATLVNMGTLAVANNLLIPAGIVVNVLIWNRDADIVRLTIGGVIILLALWVNQILNTKKHML